MPLRQGLVSASLDLTSLSLEIQTTLGTKLGTLGCFASPNRYGAALNIPRGLRTCVVRETVR
jgi:hypothetical protein